MKNFIFYPLKVAIQVEAEVIVWVFDFSTSTQENKDLFVW